MNGGGVSGSPASTLSQAELVRTTVAYLKQLTVDKLKKVLRDEGLQVSGLKNELQRRLISHVYTFDARNDLLRLRQIHNVVKVAKDGFTGTYDTSPRNPYPHTLTATAGYPSPYSNQTPGSSASPQTYYNSPDPRARAPSSIPAMPNFNGIHGRTSVSFKDSPFYKILGQLGTTAELRIRETTRDTARINISLDAATAQRFANDSSIRAMVFCAAEAFDTAYRPSEIAFPAHAELKCNQEEVKSNLKGLKNKPGSTRPVDITPFLRKKASFPNTVELMYALTNKKYFLMVYQVQKKSIETLVKELKSGKQFSKERVIREMQSQAEDDDIVTEYSRMSLKDPVQMTRIETPCRSISCKHNDCFDASVFLALQEQAPTWTCPICNKTAAWEHLVFDQFFYDILLKTPKDIEQVRVEPDGQWSLIKEEEDDQDNSHRQSNPNPNNDSDDDIIEISDLSRPRPATTYFQPSASPFAITTPPPLNGASFSNGTSSHAAPPPPPSGQGSQPQSQSRKRPREDNVIDLTLSDDDDEPPVSRVKRPSMNPSISDLARPDGSTVPYRFSLPPPPSRNTGSPANMSDYDRYLATRI